MKIVIPGERPMSWNQFYSGRHWSVRQQEAERVHAMVYAHLPPIVTVYDEKVDIFITAYFKNRPYDSDNICAKLYVDGLKGKVLKDDTSAHVGFVAVRSEVDAKNPRLEIVLRESQTGIYHNDHTDLDL